MCVTWGFERCGSEKALRVLENAVALVPEGFEILLISQFIVSKGVVTENVGD